MKERLLKTSKDFISFLHKKRLVLTICAIITLAFGLLNIFVFSNHSEALDSDAFITTWKVSGDSDGRTVKYQFIRIAINIKSTMQPTIIQ